MRCIARVRRRKGGEEDPPKGLRDPKGDRARREGPDDREERPAIREASRTAHERPIYSGLR
jgi:hypothetical protein